jgi:Zn-dependent protease
MDPKVLIDGLILYLGLVVLLTFHEFGHAWTAWKCGDDTARLEGRVSLNPIVHMDLIGTVILPLLLILVPAAGGFLVGWAKPVPVNPANFRNRHMDDILVTLAGPWMNLLLAFVIMGLARGGMLLESESMREMCVEVARLSLLLCFFNLLPIPPLDGSQVVRVLLGMSWEAYYRIARYGFLILILVLQIRQVQVVLAMLTNRSLAAIADWLGVRLF